MQRYKKTISPLATYSSNIKLFWEKKKRLGNEKNQRFHLVVETPPPPRPGRGIKLYIKNSA
jgi:hypothetical protein